MSTTITTIMIPLFSCGDNNFIVLPFIVVLPFVVVVVAVVGVGGGVVACIMLLTMMLLFCCCFSCRICCSCILLRLDLVFLTFPLDLIIVVLFIFLSAV